jgi:hypothetical protein
MALFTGLLLELAEMEFWPAFVRFWPTVLCLDLLENYAKYKLQK